MTIPEIRALEGEALRIAVAEAEGWKKTNSTTHNGNAVYTLGNKRAAVAICNIDMQRGLIWLPDFSGSRDAITEAILRRFESQAFRITVACVLMELRNLHPVGCVPDYECDRSQLARLILSDAADLCRAFLIALIPTENTK